jgi:uracil-DNA glycosylase
VTSLFPLPPTTRISGKPVPAFFPEFGAVHSLVYGEAPGPRGADKSGLPFWGDGAGIPLYRALAQAGCAAVPANAWLLWDGSRLTDAGLRPALSGVVLSNAFAACPTADGHKFRAPSKAELESSENLTRLRSELLQAAQRGATQVVTLGKCAARTLTPLAGETGLRLVALAHPSAQGLLSEAPNRGRGLRLADLQAAWIARLAGVLSSRPQP